MVEAVVTGVPYLDLGEKVTPVVLLRQGASAKPAELKQFIKERVAPYYPRRRIQLVKELPKKHTGKILKGAIQSED